MSSLVLSAEHFINRELSWLEFNARVLEEAEDATTPLLERVKFLSIFSSNLDEFFMVRVAGLREQAFGASAPQDYNADGMQASSQLAAIAARAEELVQRQYRCLRESVLPQLADEGIHLLPAASCDDSPELDRFFRETVFPIVTPMAIDPSHPRPRYHNRGLYLAAMLQRRTGLGPRQLFAVVQLPGVVPRLVPVRAERGHAFVFVEDLLSQRLPELFGGYDLEAVTSFRVTRDSDLDVIEQESDDMLRLIEERLKQRRRADAVRLEVAADADERLVQRIVDQEQLRLGPDDKRAGYSEVYRVPGPVDLTGLMGLLKTPGYAHLRDRPFIPQTPRGLRRFEENLFDSIARGDILLHHPFDSFRPVVDFVEQAAADPDVLAIKQTLYRTSGDSPIVKALMEAAESGKHVTALVELKARFDEEANVTWARQMEQAGVHVVFGFLDLKTHCKVSLAVRREDAQVRRYVHLATGNYNPATARIYTDMGLFTCDAEIAADVSALFNLLTGYSQGHPWRKLVVAPDELHATTVRLIEQQTQRARDGRPARVFGKLNSLVDPRVIQALYEASEAGVSIDLIIRGICCLRPGLPGVSENIRVGSIVDRFLEHSRIMVFGPDDDCEIYLSSADWMPRNFYRRVEAMFPIESVEIRQRLLTEIIPTYLADNVKTRWLQADGSYRRRQRTEDEPAVRAQVTLLEAEGERKPPGSAARLTLATAQPSQPRQDAEATPSNGAADGGKKSRKRRKK